MGDLNGRVALVTGAARGIGAACARALAAKGAQVVCTDVIDASGVAAEINGISLVHDVTEDAQWADVIAATKSRYGGLDILVNNAGIFWLKPILAMTLEDWRRMQAVNVEGVFLGVKHAAPLLAERAAQWDGGASIVNMSSCAGITGSPLMSAYNASKGAVRLFTKAAALELASLKIRVNSVHPAVIDTAMGQAVIDDYVATGVMGGANEVRERVLASHPLGRLGRDSDIANGVAFLASDAAAFMTGSELIIDGGFTAT
jgi:NAD(P)-dependent dehydrogenase (short-subunit alcohol dehydrogenase family)